MENRRKEQSETQSHLAEKTHPHCPPPTASLEGVWAISWFSLEEVLRFCAFFMHVQNAKVNHLAHEIMLESAKAHQCWDG